MVLRRCRYPVCSSLLSGPSVRVGSLLRRRQEDRRKSVEGAEKETPQNPVSDVRCEYPSGQRTRWCAVCRWRFVLAIHTG